MSQQQRKPDVGIGYKATYKDKTGAEQPYLKLMIRVEQLSELQAEGGIIKLSVFPQLGDKKKANSPDFTVKPTMSRGGAAAKSTQASGRSNVAAGSNKFPF